MSLRLLNEIVSELTSSSGSLSTALLKTKVMLHSIGQQELTKWVNNELTGYPNDVDLPMYRVLTAHVCGNVFNGLVLHNDYPLPTGHLHEKQRAYFQSSPMPQAVGVLEEMVSGDGKRLRAMIDPEHYALFSEVFHGPTSIERAWAEVPTTAVMQIIIEIRSRLLDFILALQDKLGTNVTDDTAKVAADAVDVPQMFARAVFGPNTTIIVGNNNQQNVKNFNLKGDFSALSNELKRHGVAEDDLKLLQAAIADDLDRPKEQGQAFGPAVCDWLKGMWAKAVETSWNIELSVAGNLLTTALQNYYG